MITIKDLEQAVKAGLAFVLSEDDVEEAEVYASANGVLLARLNYTSHIPCNGVEEPKSVVNYGIGVQAVFKSPTTDRVGGKIGFGSETSDISLEGVRSALEKARDGAVEDPEFVSLAKPTGEKRTLKDYADPAITDMKNEALAEAGWKVLNGGLKVFETSESLMDLVDRPEKLTELGIIIGGDVTVLQERMAIASSAMPDVQSDESTLVMSFITSMVEREESKGSGYEASTTLAGLSDEAGREAAQNAIAGVGGVRLPTGDYNVVFGREAVMEILHYIVMPGLDTSTFYAAASPFMGKLGQKVASEKLTILDDGARKGLVGSKGITDEGLPTGRTEIIKDGVLVGLLSNWYETQRAMIDPGAKEKFGVDPNERKEAFVPRNGFRYARGGGRHFDSQPGIHPTNVVIPGDVKDTEAICKLVGNGVYIGRLWYTYPVNGLRAADFTGTIVADSFVIKDGKLDKPLRPNTMRINENVMNVLGNVIGVTKEGKPVLVWAADEIVYAPEIAVKNVHLDAIAEYMEDL
jgi:predicted Zn-dependent protease